MHFLSVNKIFNSERKRKMARELSHRNLGQTTAIMLLKLFVIFTLGTIFGWYLSAYVNERNNDSFEKFQLQLSECRNHNDILLSQFRKKDDVCDLILKEKVNEMKEQLNDCRNQNNHLRDEKKTIKNEFEEKIPILNELEDLKRRMNECQNSNNHLVHEKNKIVKE